MDSITSQLTLLIERQLVRGQEVTAPSSSEKNPEDDQEEEVTMGCKQGLVKRLAWMLQWWQNWTVLSHYKNNIKVLLKASLGGQHCFAL